MLWVIARKEAVDRLHLIRLISGLLPSSAVGRTIKRLPRVLLFPPLRPGKVRHRRNVIVWSNATATMFSTASPAVKVSRLFKDSLPLNWLA